MANQHYSLKEVRRYTAEQWLSVPSEELETLYLYTFGKIHQTLLNTSIKEDFLNETEQVFVEQIVEYISRGFEQPKIINYLLAAMLYCRADQLPLKPNLSIIPKWLLNDYLRFLFNSQPYFQQCGQANNYYDYIQGWINYLHKSFLRDSSSLWWQNVITQFMSVAKLNPLYLNEKNIKDIYIKHTEIIEEFLKVQGYEIDYEFGDRQVTRKKLRLGILATHFAPSAETFASLPVYEYISRDFEVILYSLRKTEHPLEQYCKSCANSFKLLPTDITDQVNLIRADDLDILFLGTNVTAVTTPICLISLHRLARLQVTSIASVVTTGIRHVDYYISGQLTDWQADAEQHYREKLVKLEGTAHCFSYGSEQAKATVKINREILGISQKTVILISGANFFKIIPELIDTWAKTMAALPNSVLMLLPFGPNWSKNYPKQVLFNNLNAIFSSHGVAAERFIVLDPQPVPNREDIKEYYKVADIYLDSYPLSGTTSLIEPLEVGLPVIARQGNCLRSAMGAAMLQALGVPDLVADSEESYIQLAIALGTNPELRQQKRKQIQQKMQNNPSFLDSRAYSAKMGVLFQELFRKYLAEDLSNTLHLKDINLIVFPNWNQPEELLAEDLAKAIRAIAHHPDKSRMTLLIDTSNIADEEDANFFLSSVAMNLLMEEDLDVTEELEICLVGKLGEIQWQALLPCLQARIVLENEDKGAIAIAKAENLPLRQLDSFD